MTHETQTQHTYTKANIEKAIRGALEFYNGSEKMNGQESGQTRAREQMAFYLAGYLGLDPKEIDPEF